MIFETYLPKLKLFPNKWCRNKSTFIFFSAETTQQSIVCIRHKQCWIICNNRLWQGKEIEWILGLVWLDVLHPKQRNSTITSFDFFFQQLFCSKRNKPDQLKPENQYFSRDTSHLSTASRTCSSSIPVGTRNKSSRSCSFKRCIERYFAGNNFIIQTFIVF